MVRMVIFSSALEKVPRMVIVKTNTRLKRGEKQNKSEEY